MPCHASSPLPRRCRARTTGCSLKASPTSTSADDSTPSSPVNDAREGAGSVADESRQQQQPTPNMTYASYKVDPNTRYGHSHSRQSASGLHRLASPRRYAHVRHLCAHEHGRPDDPPRIRRTGWSPANNLTHSGMIGLDGISPLASAAYMPAGTPMGSSTGSVVPLSSGLSGVGLNGAPLHHHDPSSATALDHGSHHPQGPNITLMPINSIHPDTDLVLRPKRPTPLLRPPLDPSPASRSRTSPPKKPVLKSSQPPQQAASRQPTLRHSHHRPRESPAGCQARGWRRRCNTAGPPPRAMAAPDQRSTSRRGRQRYGLRARTRKTQVARSGSTSAEDMGNAAGTSGTTRGGTGRVSGRAWVGGIDGLIS